MTTFQVNDMTCGHCAGRIEQAVKQLDPQAQVQIDLAVKEVRVHSGLEPIALQKAIEQAGYSAQQR